jgi:hypothetical protein
MSRNHLFAIGAAALALALGTAPAAAYYPWPDRIKPSAFTDRPVAQRPNGIIIMVPGPAGQSDKMLLPAVKPPKSR